MGFPPTSCKGGSTFRNVVGQHFGLPCFLPDGKLADKVVAYMKQCLRILKWAACLYGGGVAVSFLTVVSTAFYFGLHDPEGAVAFLNVWVPILGGLGVVIGGLIVF